MIGSMIRFQNIEVSDVMTPRTVVSATAQEQTIGDYFKRRKENQFSRIPTHSEGNKDLITGYILKVDVMEALVDGRAQDSLAELRRDIVAIAEDFAVTELFKILTQRKEHIAVVLDDFGGMAGIITMEDIIETLLGMEIMDETDTTIDMRVLAQSLREKRAKALGALETVSPKDEQESQDE